MILNERKNQEYNIYYINNHKFTKKKKKNQNEKERKKKDILSVLGLNSGCTVKYNPLPSGVYLGFAL